MGLLSYGRQPVSGTLHDQLYPQPTGTVPIWVNGRHILRSPITEPGSLGNTIKIKALSRELGNAG